MTSPFAELLSQAITDRGLTLDRLSARLKGAGVPVSVATLSSWQTGKSTPARNRSKAALEELDHILGLEPGALIDSLSDRPRWGMQQLLPAAESTEQLLAELRLTTRHTWSRLSMHDRMFIDANRHEVRQRARSVMRAEVDGAQRWPIILQQDTTVPGSVADLRGINGLDIMEIRQDPEMHITVASASLPAPVRRGAVVVVEYETMWGPQSDASFRLERLLPNAASELVLEIDFDCEMPSNFRRYHGPGVDDGREQYFDDVVVHGRWAQSVLLEPQVGLHGICWEWPDAKPTHTPERH